MADFACAEETFFAPLPIVLSASRLPQSLRDARRGDRDRRRTHRIDRLPRVARLFRLVPGMQVAQGGQPAVGDLPRPRRRLPQPDAGAGQRPLCLLPGVVPGVPMERAAGRAAGHRTHRDRAQLELRKLWLECLPRRGQYRHSAHRGRRWQLGRCATRQPRHCRCERARGGPHRHPRPAPERAGAARRRLARPAGRPAPAHRQPAWRPRPGTDGRDRVLRRLQRRRAGRRLCRHAVRRQRPARA